MLSLLQPPEVLWNVTSTSNLPPSNILLVISWISGNLDSSVQTHTLYYVSSKPAELSLHAGRQPVYTQLSQCFTDVLMGAAGCCFPVCSTYQVDVWRRRDSAAVRTLDWTASI